MDQKLQWEIIAKNAASEVIREVQKELKDLVGVTKDAAKATKDSAKENQSAALSFRNLVGGIALGNAAYEAFRSVLGGVTNKLKEFAGDSVESALTVERLSTTIYGMGENMGRSREEIDGIIYSIRQENKSMREAMEITQGIIIANLDAADAQTLLTIARDTGAAMGVSSADANRLILESLQSLKVAQLETIGLVISERTAYSEYAASLGKAQSELSATEKRQAIWNQIVKQSAAFQGQYNLSMTTGQKVIGSMKDAFEDIRTVAGQLVSGVFEPMAAETLNLIRDFRKWAYTSDNELNPQLKAIAQTIYNTIVPAFSVLIEVIKVFGKTTWEILTNVNTALDATGTKTEEEVERSKKTMRTWGSVFASFAAMLVSVFKLIGRVILGAVEIIIGGIANMWNTMVVAAQEGARQVISVIQSLIKAVNTIFKAVGKEPIVFNAELDFGAAKINSASLIGAQGLENIGGGLGDFMKDMMSITNMQEQIITGPADAAQKAHSAGVDAGYEWLDGLQSAVNDASGSGSSEDMMKKLSDEVNGLVDDYDKAVFDIDEDLLKLQDSHEKEIGKITDSIDDLQGQLGDLEETYRNTMSSMNQQEAERVVEQEQNIAEMKDQLTQMQSEGGNDQDIQALQEKLNREEQAYKDYMATREGLDADLEEARRRAGLTDFERFVEDITAKRDEETTAFEEKKANIEAEIAILEESKAHEIAIYEATRLKYMEVKDAFTDFHDTYIANLQNIESQTASSVENMANQLENLKRIMSELDSLQSGRAIEQSVAQQTTTTTTTGNSNAGVNNINITVNGVQSGSEQNAADAIARELELRGLGSTS